MMKNIRFGVVLAVILMLGVFRPAPAAAQTAQDWQTRYIPYDVESGVICVPDGCMMNLAACETPAANQLRSIIREKMFKEGLNKEETYAYLAGVYGDEVLAAPPRHGFNWVAYLAPFVATIGGAALIYLGLEKWVSFRQSEVEEPETETMTEPIAPEQSRLLAEELKKYL